MTTLLAGPQLDLALAQTAAAVRRAMREAPLRTPRAAYSWRDFRRRTRLLLCASELWGGVTENSLALAAAIELTARAFAAHDAMAETGARADWAAVMVGDYLLARSFDLLPQGSRAEWSTRLAGLLRSRCASRLQALTTPGPRAPQELLRLARENTGALYRFCAQAGAQTAAGRGAEEGMAALLAFGESLGMLLQLRAEAAPPALGTDLHREAYAALQGLPEGPEQARLLALLDEA